MGEALAAVLAALDLIEHRIQQVGDIAAPKAAIEKDLVLACVANNLRQDSLAVFAETPLQAFAQNLDSCYEQYWRTSLNE